MAHARRKVAGMSWLSGAAQADAQFVALMQDVGDLLMQCIFVLESRSSDDCLVVRSRHISQVRGSRHTSGFERAVLWLLGTLSVDGWNSKTVTSSFVHVSGGL
ncbi:hypothetical protein L1887_63297 [Cichorium endivia]|nr:hypothetical protein L1887_63297 [Cichorium endivia]